jgi:hypothetical protein
MIPRDTYVFGAAVLISAKTVTWHVCCDLMYPSRNVRGYMVAQLVEALRYKPKCRGFNSRWSNWNFSVT